MVICNCIVNLVRSLPFLFNSFVDNISGYMSSWGNIGACRFGLVMSKAYL